MDLNEPVTGGLIVNPWLTIPKPNTKRQIMWSIEQLSTIARRNSETEQSIAPIWRPGSITSQDTTHSTKMKTLFLLTIFWAAASATNLLLPLVSCFISSNNSPTLTPRHFLFLSLPLHPPGGPSSWPYLGDSTKKSSLILFQMLTLSNSVHLAGKRSLGQCLQGDQGEQPADLPDHHQPRLWSWKRDPRRQ